MSISGISFEAPSAGRGLLDSRIAEGAVRIPVIGGAAPLGLKSFLELPSEKIVGNEALGERQPFTGVGDFLNSLSGVLENLRVSLGFKIDSAATAIESLVLRPFVIETGGTIESGQRYNSVMSLARLSDPQLKVHLEKVVGLDGELSSPFAALVERFKDSLSEFGQSVKTLANKDLNPDDMRYSAAQEPLPQLPNPASLRSGSSVAGSHNVSYHQGTRPGERMVDRKIPYDEKRPAKSGAEKEGRLSGLLRRILTLFRRGNSKR